MPILSFHCCLFLYSPSISSLDSIAPFTSFLNFFSDIYIPLTLRYPVYDFLRSSITLIQRPFTDTYHCVKLCFFVSNFYCNSHTSFTYHRMTTSYSGKKMCVFYYACVFWLSIILTSVNIARTNSII